MSKETIILTGLSLVLAPLCVSAFRRLRALENWQAKAEEFHGFLKTYLLREAVLTFQSNPNPDTDKIIEKITKGDRVTREEFAKLEEKIQNVAQNADEQKRRLKAESALELLRWAFEGEFQDSVTRRGEARNQLFRQ